MDLIAASRKRCQKLNQGQIANDPLDTERLDIAFQPKCNDLEFIAVRADHGGISPVLDSTRRTEGGFVSGTY